jgi:hypothetical protein
LYEEYGDDEPQITEELGDNVKDDVRFTPALIDDCFDEFETMTRKRTPKARRGK